MKKSFAFKGYEPFAPNAMYCGFGLVPSPVKNFSYSDLGKVNFYTLLPLYKEEIEYCNTNGIM